MQKALYIARRGKAIAGVFTTPEAARALRDCAAEEIAPLYLPGTPEPGKYVCSASGEYNLLYMQDGTPRVETSPIDTVWGWNVQSVIAALCGWPDLRGGTRTRTLCIYELDSPDAPIDVADELGSFARLYCENRGFPPDGLAVDYITTHLAHRRKKAEFEYMQRDEFTDRLVDGVMDHLRGQNLVDGRHLQARRHAPNYLSRYLTLQDMLLLYIATETHPDFARRAIRACVTDEQIDAMVARLTRAIEATARWCVRPR